MNFAVVGTNGELSNSQIELRMIVDESRIKTVKAAEVLPELVMVKNDPVPKGSRITKGLI